MAKDYLACSTCIDMSLNYFNRFRDEYAKLEALWQEVRAEGESFHDWFSVLRLQELASASDELYGVAAVLVRRALELNNFVHHKLRAARDARGGASKRGGRRSNK